MKVRRSGTVAQMENAFQVKLFDYQHAAGNYRGRVGDVYVPVALKGIVTGVFGLDNRRVARRRYRDGKALGLAQHLSSIPTSWYLPQQLGARYNFPPGDGDGQTVALLEFGGGVFPSDLTAFCKQANIPVPKVVPISVDGTPTSAQDGAEGEVMLDIEVVAGICPKATIAVYFAKFTERGWIRALDAVVQDKTHNPSVLSVSWGYAEENYIWTRQAMTQVNESLKDAALTGVTVCVSAGDDGSSDAVSDGHAHVDFPASSPYVLAVGGTTIPSKNAPLPDICWFEGDGLRDVAANADWTASPYLLVVDGNGEPNGGTSAASPLVASMMRLSMLSAKRTIGSGI
jgi:kumamolisin